MLWKKTTSPSVETPTMLAGMAANGALAILPVAVPSPAAGEVCIAVACAGVNRADLLQVAGKYPLAADANPIIGLECSGTVAAVGESVTSWSIGEHVMALCDGGAYAPFVCVPEGQVLPIPSNFSLQQAACIPEAAATSWVALMEKAALKPGETVLIHGASGGVGMLMLQLAQCYEGVQVIATASTGAKCTVLEKMGAQAINTSKHDFNAEATTLVPGGVDIIIDTIGVPLLATHLKLLKRGGRLVSLAFLDGASTLDHQVSFGAMLMRELSWHSFSLRQKTRAEKAALLLQVRKKFLPFLATGKVYPLIDGVFPFLEAEKAHARMEERLHCGKILLEMPSETPPQEPETLEPAGDASNH
jgi:NADPH:quinone reductase